MRARAAQLSQPNLILHSVVLAVAVAQHTKVELVAEDFEPFAPVAQLAPTLSLIAREQDRDQVTQLCTSSGDAGKRECSVRAPVDDPQLVCAGVVEFETRRRTAK